MNKETSQNIDKIHKQQRIDLAVAFRWTARLGMQEAIANHFSLAVSDDGSQFLMNPYGRHFSKMRASDLILIDANDPATAERDDIDPTAWGIHGAMHRKNPPGALHYACPFKVCDRAGQP